MKFTYFISAVLSLIHSPEVVAQTKSLDAVAFIPASYWTSELKKNVMGSEFKFKNEQSHFQYANSDGSLKIVSDQVSLQAHVKTEFLVFESNTISNLKMQLNEANLMAHNLNFQVVIKKDLGFGTALLRLDMHCDSVQFQLKNNNPISTQLFINKGQLQFSHINWNLQQSRIQTQLEGCKDVAGFDDLLKQQIQQKLEEQIFLETLQQLLNSHFANSIQDKVSETIKQLTQQFQIVQNQKFEFDESNNLWVSSGESSFNQFTNEEIQNLKNSTKASVLIKKSKLENITKQALNEYLFKNPITSENTSAIRKLTCSRFIQFFVWPSLRSLSKCFEMKFLTQVSQIEISNLQNLEFNLDVGSWVSGNNQSIAYFKAQVNSNISESQAELFSFNGKADPEFIKASRKSKRISINLVQPSIESLLQKAVEQISKSDQFKFFKQKLNIKQLSNETYTIEIK